MTPISASGWFDGAREWATDNRWTARFVFLEATMIASAFGLALLAGPPPEGDTEPVLLVVSGMILAYAGVIAIVAALVYAGYAAARRFVHDDVGTAA